MGADISHFKQNGVESQQQNGTKTNPELVIAPSTTPSEAKKVTKSHTITHFSDYSMFPDRFNNASSQPCKPVAILQRGHGHEEQPHFSDYSLYPDKFDQHKMHRSLSVTPHSPHEMKTGTSLPANNAGLMTKYNFKLRRNSESDHHETSESLAPSENTDAYRSRSLSNSKMYYFDFSLIPDKDPHCVIDERKKHYSDEKALPTVREGTSAPVQTTTSASKRSRKTSESRFGFFDYSMIPDKDPKCFTSKKE